MAVRINPCHGCPLRTGCNLRLDFAQRVRGLGLRSAMFDCDRLSKTLAVGTRIVVTMPTFSYDARDNEVVCGRREVKATIHASHLNTFACVIDKSDMDDMVEDGEISENVDPNKIRWRKSMRHSRIIRFLDEPRWTTCVSGNLVSPDGVCQVRHNNCDCKIYGSPAGALETVLEF